jgi:hypothetical protein
MVRRWRGRCDDDADTDDGEYEGDADDKVEDGDDDNVSELANLYCFVRTCS